MATILKAGNVATGAQITSDATGILEIRTGTGAGTTAITVGTDQAVTFAAGTTINDITVGRGGGSVATNTAVGASALAANTTGLQNTTLGASALASNTSGSGNTGLGWASLNASTTGNYNTGVGRSALGSNETGSNNTALGYQALVFNTTASNNTAVGYRAGFSNTTGVRNTYIGDEAGYLGTTAEANTAVGKNAGNSLTSGSNNTLIGGRSNSGTNEGAGFALTTGGYNNFFGGSAGGAVTTGSKNTIVGNYTGNQGGLDIRTLSNRVVVSDGDGNIRIYFDNNGYVKCQGVYNQAAAGSANVVTAANGDLYRSTSALKYKQDIRDLENIDIDLIRPVRYKSKCAIDDPTKDHFGVIADEVDAAGIVELVTYGLDGEIEGFAYDRLTVVLLKELQRLKAEVAALKGQS
jgi:hypothetical protein